MRNITTRLTVKSRLPLVSVRLLSSPARDWRQLALDLWPRNYTETSVGAESCGMTRFSACESIKSEPHQSGGRLVEKAA
jgi:hypothetical protein